MKRNIFLSVVVSGIILLLASCNDGSKGISGNRIQDSREYSAEDTLIKKTAETPFSLPGRGASGRNRPPGKMQRRIYRISGNVR